MAYYSHQMHHLQQRRGGSLLHINEKRRHNARINPPADDTTQPKSQHPMFIKAMLRRVGFNELLDFVVIIPLPEPSLLIVSSKIPIAVWRFISPKRQGSMLERAQSMQDE